MKILLHQPDNLCSGKFFLMCAIACLFLSFAEKLALCGCSGFGAHIVKFFFGYIGLGDPTFYLCQMVEKRQLRISHSKKSTLLVSYTVPYQLLNQKVRQAALDLGQ